MTDTKADAGERPVFARALNEMVASFGQWLEQANSTQNYCSGLFKYSNEFLTPFLIAALYFYDVEKGKIFKHPPHETFKSYMDLYGFNLDLFLRGFSSSANTFNQYQNDEIARAAGAIFQSIFSGEGEDLQSYVQRHARTIELVTREFPRAIREIEPEYGFHFERGENLRFAETDRFLLYRIQPTDKKVEIRKNGKPLIIIPPYVLGANILSFLPRENRSYAHSYANQGIPVYIRIMKDIHANEAVQRMSAEDDARDTRLFCEKVRAEHGKPVTLNGYCQGGFSAVCNIISGQLDGLVDALITCVSPMDGTRSKGLAQFLKNLPARFNDLAYGTKTLFSGVQVADGQLMGWVYKLKSIETEAPLVAFHRDMMMLGSNGGKPVKINKTVAALNFWLKNERSDLPLEITRMSFDSYNTPISEDGTLPVKLFGRRLNFHRIKEKKIKWLICYGESDELVEKETAMAPLDFIDVEVTGFPKGHIAIATSWSHPDSACALHKRFGEKKSRGPIRFHLDLDRALNKDGKSKLRAAKQEE